MNELELVSTNDLVKELTSRKTFVGIVIYSPHAYRPNQQIDDELHIVTSANNEIAKELLETALSAIDYMP